MYTVRIGNDKDMTFKTFTTNSLEIAKAIVECDIYVTLGTDSDAVKAALAGFRKNGRSRLSWYTWIIY